MRLLELQTLSQIRQVIVYNGNCLRQPLIAKMAGHQWCKERENLKNLLLSSLHFTSLLEMATCLIAVEGNGSHWF